MITRTGSLALFAIIFFFCLYGQGFEFSILSVMLPIYYSILRHFQQITHHIKLNYLEYYI